MNIIPVIMCGGSGSRLWPASRPSGPKQFIPLFDETSLFEQTLTRVNEVTGVRQILVVTGQKHAAWIAQQVSASRANVTVLFEPEARDSAPAIAAAAHWIATHHPGSIACVVASDHHIPDEAAFANTIELAARAAATGRIVTLGIAPRHAATAYGYIRPGDPLNLGADGSCASGDVMVLDQFVEKPDEETARGYIDKGYLWNSGNFIADAQTLVAEIERFAPDVSAPVARAVSEAHMAPGGFLLGDSFCRAQRISIDFAVMEKTDKAAVVRADWQWSDLGAWDAVHTASTHDGAGNSVRGAAVLDGVSGCVVHAAPGMAVAAVGVDNLAIVAEGDAVLVCPLERSQAVKGVVETLKARQAPQVDTPAAREGLVLEEHGLRFQHWLNTSALPFWAAMGPDHGAWGYHETLHWSGAATGDDRRVRVQLRQAITYARAGLLGWRGDWRAMIGRALDGVEAHYVRPDGFLRTKVSADGAPVDDTPLLYDQAFRLLAWGCAQAHDRVYEDRALAFLEDVERAFGHDAGGFRENADQAFQSNPHMHLLEAMLAWMDVSDHPRWAGVAERIGELALSRFIDSDTGMLREFFTEEWTPASGDAGRRVEPGHQFEWAWLLQRWGLETGRNDATAAARTLFQHGVAGIDPARGVAQDAMFDDGLVMDPMARLWPQTERLKAALLLGATSAGDDPQLARYREDAVRACASLWRYLETPTPGMWWDKMDTDGVFVEEPVTASSFYHIITAVEALVADGGVIKPGERSSSTDPVGWSV